MLEHVHIAETNLQTTEQSYIWKCGYWTFLKNMRTKWAGFYISKCWRRNPGDWNKGLFMVAMCILRRRCSRVYNVVTVNVELVLFQIYNDKHGAQVGRNLKNAIGSSLLVLKQRNDLSKFRLQDRDIYFEIKILNKNERTNIKIDGSRQG